MQEGDQEEEPLILFYQIPLRRLVAWNKWWHITARKLLRTYQKEILGFGRKLPEDSDRSGEPTPGSSENDLRSRTRPAVAAAEQHCP